MPRRGPMLGVNDTAKFKKIFKKSEAIQQTPSWIIENINFYFEKECGLLRPIMSSTKIRQKIQTAFESRNVEILHLIMNEEEKRHFSVMKLFEYEKLSVFVLKIAKRKVEMLIDEMYEQVESRNFKNKIVCFLKDEFELRENKNESFRKIKT